MQKRTKWLVALIAALAMVVAACGDDGAGEETPTTTTTAPTTTTTEAPPDTMDDMEEEPTTTTTEPPTTTTEPPMDDMDEMSMEGTRVTIFGPESTDSEAGALQDAMDQLSLLTGIEVVYTGARDFSDQINAQASGGNPPDIAVFPQPGKVADFAEQGWILPVPDDVAASAREGWNDAWMNFGVGKDGQQYALPNKADLKSLVWYNRPLFEEAGYTVPETWDELKALTNQMIADGVTPWCVGIESGGATGWPFTDWVEDLMLRFQPPEVYDQWVAGEVGFSDDRVKAIFQEIIDLWNTPGAVFASGGSIAATAFGANGEPLVNGDCMMHRQASFFAAFIPAGTSYGEEGIDVFYFPAVEAGTRPTLVAGTVVAAFRDAPEVWEVMKYFASGEYATERQKAQKARTGNQQSGFLSANLNQDLTYYNDLERSFISFLQEADPARFDGSDLMPAAVGAGTFWTEATSLVNGDITLDEAVTNLDNSWPS